MTPTPPAAGSLVIRQASVAYPLTDWRSLLALFLLSECLLLYWRASHAPAIVELEIVPKVVRRGESAKISWKTRHADSVTLEPGGQQLGLSGEWTVTPAGDTEYRLIAGRGGHQASRSIRIQVRTDSAAPAATPLPPSNPAPAPPAATPPPPSLPTPAPLPPTVTLTADPPVIQPGQSATLRWSTTDASEVLLDSTPVPPQGVRADTPRAHKTYRLVARNSAGERSAIAVVDVEPLNPHFKVVVLGLGQTVGNGGEVRVRRDRAHLTVAPGDLAVRIDFSGFHDPAAASVQWSVDDLAVQSGEYQLSGASPLTVGYTGIADLARPRKFRIDVHVDGKPEFTTEFTVTGEAR